VKRTLRNYPYSSKYRLLRSAEKKNSYRFGTINPHETILINLMPNFLSILQILPVVSMQGVWLCHCKSGWIWRS